MADHPSTHTGQRQPARRVTRRRGAVDPATGQRRSLRRQYERAARQWSDVQDHLPRFLAAVTSRDAPVVVELGSRGGVSTLAWLYGCEQTGGQLWTVDLAPAPPLPSQPFWTHVQGDDLDSAVQAQLPASIDVLFIDTSHDHEHTLAELRAYVLWVVPGGVVFLHDTDLERPDGIAAQEPFPVRRALDRFCAETGMDWVEHPGSYGLGEIRL